MWFHTSQRRKKTTKKKPKVSGRPLKEVSKFTYLGAILDKNVTFKQHSKKSLNAVNLLNFKLWYIRHMLPMHAAISLYKQTILPHFDYCSFLIDGSTVILRKRIQAAQNRILRCVLKVKKGQESTQNIHKLCEAPMQDKRRKELLVSMMYRKHRKNPPKQTRSRTRNDCKSNFEVPKPKLTLRKKSPLYRGKMLWNKLPSEVQLAETKESFKARTKVWFETNMKGKRAALLKKREARKPP